MRRPSFLLPLLAAGAALLPVRAQQPAPGPSAGGAWPRTFAEGPVSLEVHPPQVAQWTGDTLSGRAAVAQRTDGSDDVSYAKGTRPSGSYPSSAGRGGGRRR